MAQLLMSTGLSAHHTMPDMEGMEAMATNHALMVGADGKAEPECCEGHEQGMVTVCKTGQECKTKHPATYHCEGAADPCC